ncbi:MAG TPA: tRNA (adenosine(37)-N6)-threonylcarbamoyltransferase complex dimerization subunit type 1 TsaB [Stellaceae bacterium]|nr:tRNA (adenosine(37)-N6)-threonylcarbamoyltransferase complex dimerization subunit type 1 TsaB [Stellaceae bacterium]
MTGKTPQQVVLALDSAGSACSVAVGLGKRVLADERIDTMHGQAEALLPLVDRAMRKAGQVPAALDLVAVTVGPGSFTGIRVGLAAARGIALATGARLIGVTSFDAVAVEAARSDCSDGRFLLIALESRREDLYVQFFDLHGDPLCEPAAIMPSALGDAVDGTIGRIPLLIAGDAAQRAGAPLARRQDTRILKDSAPGAVGVLRAGLRRLRLGKPTTTRPLYLRPPDVTLPAGPRKPSLART